MTDVYLCADRIWRATPFTPRRLEVLRAVRCRGSYPSLSALSRDLGRALPNVGADVQVLSELGLVRVGHGGSGIKTVSDAPSRIIIDLRQEDRP